MAVDLISSRNPPRTGPCHTHPVTLGSLAVSAGEDSGFVAMQRGAAWCSTVQHVPALGTAVQQTAALRDVAWACIPISIKHNSCPNIKV